MRRTIPSKKAPWSLEERFAPKPDNRVTVLVHWGDPKQQLRFQSSIVLGPDDRYAADVLKYVAPSQEDDERAERVYVRIVQPGYPIVGLCLGNLCYRELIDRIIELRDLSLETDTRTLRRYGNIYMRPCTDKRARE